MEYVQMTLDDWLGMKKRLQQELMGMKQSFVRTGYILRQIEDSKGYEMDGYKSLAEFAKAEYGLSSTSVSRFKAINKAYSIDNYSEMIDPAYADFKKSMLEEMLTLPAEDRQLITPETTREVIRELKHHNEEVAALVQEEQERGESAVEQGAESVTVAEEGTETATDAEEGTETATDAEEVVITENASATPKENKPKKVRSIRDLVEEFYRANPDVVTEVFTSEAYTTGEVKKLVEIVNPSGNRTYKNGLWFMVMYENGVRIKEFAKVMQEIGWGEFFILTQEIFAETASGVDTYRNHFGELPEPPEPEHQESSQSRQAASKTKKPVEKSTKAQEKIPETEVKVVNAEGRATASPKSEEPVEKPVDNLPQTEIAPAQKSLKEPGMEAVLEVGKTDEAEQWKTAAYSAAEEVRLAMESSAWGAAVTSARQLLHFLELVEHAEGGKES